MIAKEIAQRLLSRDSTLWPEDNVSGTRMGWLDSPSTMAEVADDITSWANSVSAERIVLIGMGGSSLGPEVLRACAGNERLLVLDTTDPETISSVPTSGSFFLVSSKSGSTLEVQALLAYFWRQTNEDGSRFAAITDPNTELHSIATDRKFSKIFVNDPNIGGRYSVLSYFGIVPAALMGYDIKALVSAATSVDIEAAVQLGIDFGTAAKEGRDKITIVTPTAYQSFGLWIEQLIAESTGKSGRGCVPIPTCEEETGPDRYVVKVSPSIPTELGAEFYRWQIATATAGHVLGIDPFNEPNVKESKENTNRVLADLPLSGDQEAVVSASNVIEWLKETYKTGDYVSLQAYTPYWQETSLYELRKKVRDSLNGAPVTAGLGPRFLHSTGQLHKGGANNIIAVQILPESPTGDAEIPGFSYDFNTLIRSQAEGDLQSLRTHGRRVIRVLVKSLEEVQ